MSLPNPSMSFSPFAILTASEMNDLVENIEALAAGTGLNSSAVATSKIADASVTNAKLASGATRLGINKVNTTGTVVAATYTTYATVTATSTGRECEVDFRAILGNGSSGADRSVIWRVQCDGVDIAPAGLNIGLRNGSPTNTDTVLSFIVSSTPSAGSHTWVLQLQASNASAVVLDGAVLKVSEIA